MFGTIVVGVDESGHADHAVQAVTRIAQATGDKVVVQRRPETRRSIWLIAT